jgi:hypothetical protein
LDRWWARQGSNLRQPIEIAQDGSDGYGIARRDHCPDNGSDSDSCLTPSQSLGQAGRTHRETLGGYQQHAGSKTALGPVGPNRQQLRRKSSSGTLTVVARPHPRRSVGYEAHLEGDDRILCVSATPFFNSECGADRVVSGPHVLKLRCPLYPAKADMCGAAVHVRFGPKADICDVACRNRKTASAAVSREIQPK